jgi:plastocyanin
MSRLWLLPVALLALAFGFSFLFAQPQTTFTVVNNGSLAYTIDGTDDPDLKLTKGQTYVFQVSAVGHPFWIKTVRSTGTGNAYSNGVTNNGTQSGSLTFVVPADAPATLFYDCQIHSNMTGKITVTDPTPALLQTWGRTKAAYR